MFAFVAAWVVSLLTYRRNAEIQPEFIDTGTMVAVPRPHAIGDTP